MTELRKALIILSPGFPKDETDSTCLPFPQLFVKTLKKLYPRLHVLVIAFEYPFSVARYSWHGVEVIPFNGWKKGKIRKLLILRMILKEISIVAKQNNLIGILSLWLGECALAGKYASNKLQVPWFTWLMGQDAKSNNRFYKLARPKAENLVALSDFLVAEFYKNYQVKPAYVIPPGIDPEEFDNAIQSRTIDIIGVGSLIPLKQYDVFIRIIEKLVEKHPYVKACICGNGPEKDRLEQLIENSSLQQHIQLMDETQHEEVLKLMGQSRILLHCSSYEGFATVYTEALYAGAHVIRFCNPMTELFDHLYIASDEHKMLELADRLLSSKNLDHRPVLTYHINETCKHILLLFDKDNNIVTGTIN